ncbi:gas vesicle protein [Streptomyces sp. ISL-10]|uniref:gas vesicle protein n=1 Tax=Streptomyces sp. ISL-10 TaxID=2819172 RepID=UPI001BE997C2|nr:gas vesicle protein [Streptomyces sp. ISL-10]MBT2365663.1 gas vesicle protein [Streptomyces sp. ISL-10]
MTSEGAHPPTTGSPAPLPGRQIALIDLLDRLLTSGVVVTGDITLSIADIDLVRISLRALIVSISAENPSPWDRRPLPLPPSSPPPDRHAR